MSLWELILAEVALCIVLVLARQFIPETAQPIKKFVIWALIIVAVWVFAVAIGLIGALQKIAVPHV